MAVSIGKRKRLVDEDENEQDSGDEDAMRALFQRAFEAKFKPLGRTHVANLEPEADIESEDDVHDVESDWSGLSGDDEKVETINYDTSITEIPGAQPHERKAFMSSKPPSSGEDFIPHSKVQDAASEDDPSEVANKKHDLALQRLLKESHLLDPGSFKSTASDLQGKGRLKAIDLRMKDLGAKDAASQQQKMPLSHRKGIVAKASGREERRRRDALENGVILEKAKGASKSIKHRDKGIGGPAVGKFRGGTLKIRQRDVRSLQDDRRKRSW